MKNLLKRETTLLIVLFLLGTSLVYSQVPKGATVDLNPVLNKTDEELKKWVESQSKKHLNDIWAELNAEGELRSFKSNYAQLETIYRKALVVANSLQNNFYIGKSWHWIGSAVRAQTSRAKAFPIYLKAEAAFSNSPTKESQIGIGRLWVHMAQVYFHQRNPQKAFNLALKARSIGVRENAPRLTALADITIADFFRKTGAIPEAMAFLEDARIRLPTENNDKLLFDIAKDLGNIYQGLIEWKIADKERMKMKYHLSLYPNRYRQMQYWRTKSVYDAFRGDIISAQESMQNSSKLLKELGFEKSLIGVRLALGALWWRDDYEKAKHDLTNLLRDAQALRNGGAYEASVLTAIGTIHAYHGNPAEAEKAFTSAKKMISEKFPRHRGLNIPLYLKLLQYHYFRQKRYVDAYEAANKAISFLKYNRNMLPATYAYKSLIGLRIKKLTIEESDALINEAIQMAESRRVPFTKRGTSFGSLYAGFSIYSLKVLQALEKNELEEAFLTSDSYKSRWLLDQISVRNFNAYPENWLNSEDAQKLRSKILEKTLLFVTAKSEKVSEELKELKGIHKKRNKEFQDKRLEFSNYKKDYLTPVELKNIVEANPDTAYVSYTFTPEGLKTFVSRAAKGIKVFSVDLDSLEIHKKIRRFRNAIASFDPDHKQLSTDLYNSLLKPIEKEIRSSRHLVIIPDRGLWELPFQSLIDMQGKYLIEKHSISYAPSLKVLHTLLEKLEAKETFNRQDLVAFGNPANELISSLPETELEVRRLGRFFSKSTVFVKAKATESTLKRVISNAKILHLATHGKLDSDDPMKSAVYLTPDKNADGLFEVGEIIDQKLNANLVVLSACDTSNGKVVNGEGMMSLSWAFLAAGARSVLATQWSVESKSTSENMQLFYKHLFDGKNKAEAIQAVMKERINGKPPFNHPYYWAGFVSIGDFR